MSFGSTVVLDRATIAVERGGLTAVIGASGSGKSTLLRAIAGFADLTLGRVVLDGDDLTATAPEARPIASLFQTARLFPALNVRSNVSFGLRVRGASKEEQDLVADGLLARVGLPDFGNATVDNLSGGEQQRVALARALAFTPRLILMDEPFSAVDTPRRRELRSLVAELLEEHQMTSLLVTHDIADAKSLADRIAVIADGRVLQEGPLDEVLSNPSTPVVADLIRQ